MSAPSVCPRCGSPVPPAAPAGECPACLVRLAVGAADPPPPFAAADLQARFPELEVLEPLGRGGMAVVFKVRHPVLDRLAAMKLLAPEHTADPEYAERFLREARAQAQLAHPHIVGVYDFGRRGDLVYLLMEYVDGTTLRELLRAGRTTPGECLRLVGQMCDALQYAHDRRIVHRDVKPENVLVDRTGSIKLADFGLAKLGGGSNLTQPGDRMGTARYMAPEQWANTASADHRADIYSLGVLFYELLTGDLPTPQFTPPSEKAGTDRRLDRVVSKSLRDAPDERYQQAAELRTDVDRIAARRPWGWQFAAAAGAVVLVAAVVWWPMSGTRSAAPRSEYPGPGTPDPVAPPADEWELPVHLGVGVNSPHGEGSPCLSADGLTIWFHSDRPGGIGLNDLYTATRRTPDEPFGAVTLLGPPVSALAPDFDPCVSLDGQTLVFVSARRGGSGGTDLWMSRRPDPTAEWGTPTNLGPMVNSRVNEYRPWLSADALILTFTSTRPPIDSVWLCRRATPADEFGPPELLGKDAHTLYLGGPSFSADRKRALFNRHNDAFPANLLWQSAIDDPADPFRRLASFGPVVNGPHIDTNPAEGPDGRTVYFASDRPGGLGGPDLWMTRRK